MEKRFRIAEIFGPTIQGEGRRIGTPCHFIRVGGCDFRCSWCDTPHAVLDHEVAKLPRMTSAEIIGQIWRLPQGPKWVVISGGNPGLLDLSDLVISLHKYDYLVMLETQGSTYRKWYAQVDDLCFSPKPPSSGNTSDLNLLDRILKKMWAEYEGPYTNRPYLKVVVFDDADYEYAHEVSEMFKRDYSIFVSVGNEDPSLPTVGNPEPPPGSIALTQTVVLDKMRWLMEKVAADPRMAGVRVLPQMHTLAWGNSRGR